MNKARKTLIVADVSNAMHDSLAEIIDRYSPFPSLVVGMRDLSVEEVTLLYSCLEQKFTRVRDPQEEAIGLYERPDFPGLISRKSWNQLIHVTMDVWSDATLATIVYLDVAEKVKDIFKTWGKATYAHVTFHIGLPYEEKSEVIEEQEIPPEELGECFSSGTVLMVDLKRPPLDYFVRTSQALLCDLFPDYPFVLLTEEPSPLQE